MKLRLLEENKRKNGLFCSYKFCPLALGNKEHRSGAGISEGQMQAPRAKCSDFCMHPRCMRGFHSSCWSCVHRLIPPERLPTAE